MGRTFDLVISGARVIDPETQTDEILYTGLEGGVIAALSREPLEGKEEIDGRGFVLAPGFIDIHTHEDIRETGSGGFNIPREIAWAALRAGNTTILGGNCGYSNYPMGKYLSALKGEDLPLNCLSLVGNCTLRQSLGIGDYEAASPAQIVRMTDMALAALDEGAAGVSFGLQYAPGTSFVELLTLATAANEKGKFFAVHMRYDIPSKALEALKEVIAAAEITGAALQISHLAANVYGGNNIQAAAKLISESGADISADVYPYDTWATGIRSAVFDKGFGNFNFKVTDLEILSGPLAGQYCTPALFEELRRASQDTSVACHNAIPMGDIEAALKLPFVCLGSDAMVSLGPEGQKKGHPRLAGSPARFLREFVFEKKLFPLTEAIRKLTLIPANRLGLSRKGRIQAGLDADLTLFDPETITDTSGFGVDICARPPLGIKAVILGGKIACRT